VPIDYTMAREGGSWKVYDVVIDGVSLVTTYRGSFSDQIRQGGIDGLIKTLGDRNAALSGSKVEAKK
jgi:phospholipid transport system substrate-binding protein